jgi:hypothetical protein
MGAPSSLLQGARAFARDMPRDSLPKGFLWDVCDFVPALVDADLTGRGGWVWGSPVLDSEVWAGIVANFPALGDRLLVQSAGHAWYDVALDGSAASGFGSANSSNQNPVQLVDTVIHCSEEDQPMQLVTAPGGVITVATAPAPATHARRACIYKAMLVHAAAPGEEDVVRFSVPGENLATSAAYDPNSFLRTSRDVTALTALRGMVLVFHKNMVERIRGSTPPYSPDGVGDMFLEIAFDRIGCSYPKTVATWNENVIFADEHGVHMTDGTIVRNIAAQGNILSYWRPLYEATSTACACTFLDYYMITLRYADADSSVTLICDLNRRQWYRFSNVRANTYISSSGGVARPYILTGDRGTTQESLWAGQNTTGRLIRVDPCFFPVFGAAILDGDGAPVLPVFETGWYRLAEEGRKRIRFGYLSYDARLATPDPVLEVAYLTSPQQPAYTISGSLPGTADYTRRRFPVSKFPYGVAFRVRQTAATTATRIHDLAAEAWPAERSRV